MFLREQATSALTPARNSLAPARSALRAFAIAANS